MTIRVLDSTALVDPDEARAAGYAAQLAYLLGDSVMTAEWVGACTAADFGIGSIFELDSDAVALGEAQGVHDAGLAVAAARALGQPKGTAIYAACDTDPDGLPGGPAGAVPYFQGFALVREAGFLAGAYIGAAGANACLAAGAVDRIAIPGAPAWADGETPRREDVVQGWPYVVIAGSDYDPDWANPDDAGLWTLNGPWPARPVPVPTAEDDMILITVIDPVDGQDDTYVLFVSSGKLHGVATPADVPRWDLVVKTRMELSGADIARLIAGT
jgi:hypothetical protein